MSLELRGCGTALVTPFRKDGSLDLDALRRLVQFQLRPASTSLSPAAQREKPLRSSTLSTSPSSAPLSRKWRGGFP